MRKILYYFGLICIAFFLFSIHAKYLQDLVPGKDSPLFVLFGKDLKPYMPYAWGAAFGIVTAIIISLLNKKDKMFWYFIFAVAILEIIGVFLYNNTEIRDNWFKMFSSTYYGFYTGFIVIAYAYIKQSNKEENEYCIISDKELEEYKAIVEKQIEKEQESLRIEEKTNENDNENHEKVKRMLSKGMKPKDIASELGLHISTVYRIKKNTENENTSL